MTEPGSFPEDAKTWWDSLSPEERDRAMERARQVLTSADTPHDAWTVWKYDEARRRADAILAEWRAQPGKAPETGAS